MKPANLPALALILVLISCNQKQQNNSADKAVAVLPTMTEANLLGSFVGDFGANKITLLITRAENDSIAGRSVVGGNDRPFTGTITKSSNAYTITAKEPGDDKNDGIFVLTIDPAKTDDLTGNWKPYNTATSTDPKEFALHRKAFVYLKDVGEYPAASKRLLTEDDVNNLAKEELENMRNEIFARHGYCFKKKNLRENFEDKDWYIPNTVDVKKDLTEIEKKNIVLIKKFEKYAEEFGDSFGR